ncbi:MULTISPECIES: ABC transporter ATP-binding protein [unclassified Microbacterium]|uniref:ABC transporter ATP-binding protein n=1 Tax=unclassified Microbacterium TaxID=2609290 RepID=UPI00097EF032|nr:ABC transporter ATP-binding protein [Microbacterium sp. JB110]SJM68946.1 L-proline glycine betaine ABC transport system permease protein ProV (TC 3.A.1.12.1) [Frigoribacterium sp. JB110]
MTASTRSGTSKSTNGATAAFAHAGSSVGIELDGVTKRYQGQEHPAVEDFTMSVSPGELVMFVGPSGCGKTTTMKMINRIIEPTSGSIRIADQDVLSLEPNELRRHIGYVIQQIGLFPHLTIFDNIATVPKLLGWSKSRIAERVDELLRLVDLDPGVFARRYPKELSGGQQQRVGVARALAADPPVMLMDEPFGATDPITRDGLQAEFLKIQEGIGKTIVFVTHDFDEAIKLGDRIAVLSDRSQIEQFDTPANILAAPANDYVQSFIGKGAALKRLALIGLSHVDLTGVSASTSALEVDEHDSLRDALDMLVRSGASSVRVTRGDRVVGAIDFDTISTLLDADARDIPSREQGAP